MKDLTKILYPKSVAIVGASEKEGSVGNELLKHMLEFGYTGKIYPINPKHTQIMGLKCYAKITDVPKEIQLAIVAVPAKTVLDVVEQCHLAQVDDIVLISSGFNEIGGEGTILENELKAKVQKYGMNLVGPNCLGVFCGDKKLKFDGCFAPTVPKTGTVGFATQSGALAGGVFNISKKLRIGFNQMVSLGNQADVDALDVISQWENDDNVSQILLYLESIKNPQKFRKVATKVAMKKPILCIKSGRSTAGAKAAASHTGSLAGSDNLAEGLLASCGVVREISLKNLFDDAGVLGNLPLPKGKRLAILTNAGGPGILATDVASDFGLEIPTFSDELQAKLKEITMPQASRKNPVDLVASCPAIHYKNTAEVLLKNDETDMLLVIYLYIAGKHDMEVFEYMQELQKKYPKKPIILTYMTVPEFFDDVKKKYPESTIPLFDYVDDAVRGFKLLCDRKDFLEGVKEKTPIFDVKKDKTTKIFEKAKKEARTLLSTKESLEVFKNYGLPVPKFVATLKLADAIKNAKKMGFPVVLKMSSKTISHKTDVGGVVVNIKDEKELEIAWKNLEQKLKNADMWDALDGIIVMKQIKGSREFVAGIVESAGYGHQMMFGIGGIFVEALKEVCFRPCPLKMYDAKALVNSTKAKKLLGNIRGKKAVDETKVVESLLKLSKLVEDFKDIKELDVNPFMLDDEGNFFAVDARIVTK